MGDSFLADSSKPPRVQSAQTQVHQGFKLGIVIMALGRHTAELVARVLLHRQGLLHPCATGGVPTGLRGFGQFRM